MPPFQPFQLSVQLSTHEADVRPESAGKRARFSSMRDGLTSPRVNLCLTALSQVRSVFSPSASLIVSSSRDKSAIAWVRGADGWTLGKRWEGLGGFVGAAWAGVIGGTSASSRLSSLPSISR